MYSPCTQWVNRGSPPVSDGDELDSENGPDVTDGNTLDADGDETDNVNASSMAGSSNNSGEQGDPSEDSDEIDSAAGDESYGLADP